MPTTTTTALQTPAQEREDARTYVLHVATVYHLDRFTDEVLRGWRMDPQRENDRSLLTYHARRYARAYEGSSSFMQAMRGVATAGTLFTLAMTRGVLNVILADARRAAAPVPEVRDVPLVNTRHAYATQPVTPVVPDGYYTIVLSEQPEVRRTIRVRTPRQGTYSARMGWQYVAFLSGSDNESSYTGFGRLEGARTRLDGSYRRNEQLGLALELLVGYAQKDQLDNSRQRFALVSGRCWNCGRTLTVPASIHRGLGPDCAARLGAL